MIHYQPLGCSSDERDGSGGRVGTLASRGVSPQLQAADRGREVPVPQGQRPAQPLAMRLFSVGIAPSTRARHWTNQLPGPPTAVGTLAAAFASKLSYSITCAGKYVSPNYDF